MEFYIEQFATLSINANEAEITECFNTNVPGYGDLNDQSILELITSPENVGEEEDNDIANVEV